MTKEACNTIISGRLRAKIYSSCLVVTIVTTDQLIEREDVCDHKELYNNSIDEGDDVKGLLKINKSFKYFVILLNISRLPLCVPLATIKFIQLFYYILIVKHIKMNQT